MIGTSRKPACANYYDSGYPKNPESPESPEYPEYPESPESPEKNSYSAIQIVTRFLSFSLNGCTREPFEL